MSLAKAVLAVADRMESYAKDVDGDAKTAITGWVGMLRVAVEAAEGAPYVENSPASVDILEAQAAMRAQRLQQQAVIRLQETERQAKREEGAGASMVELVDDENPSDVPTMVELDPQMPVGAYTPIAGRVYQLQADRKLHFDAKQTERLKKGG